MPSRSVKSVSSTKSLRIQSSSQQVILERVLGFTSFNNSSVSLDSEGGIFAYAAGCVVVLRSFSDDRQRFIQSNAKKSITAVEFSPDGRYIATGESGHQPMVRIWSVADGSQQSEFPGHHFRVIAVRFSPSGRYLVSLGSQEDNTLFVWDRITKQRVASAKVTNKINGIAFSPDGQFFVTVGVRHIRYWYLETKRTRHKETIPLNGRNAVLGDLLNKTFMDVCCVTRVRDQTQSSDNATQDGLVLILIISKAGQLLQFGDQRCLDKWVELRTKANCLAAHGSTVVVGCTHGTCLLFNAEKLQFLTQVPLPNPLGSDAKLFRTPGTFSNATADQCDPSKFPDLLAIRLDCIHARLICFYSDHSLYVWNIGDLSNIRAVYSDFYHSRGVWSIDCLPEMTRKPSVIGHDNEDSANRPRWFSPSTFVTCADDGTIRFWDIGNEFEHHDADNSVPTSPAKEMLVHIIYTDPTHQYLCVNDRVSSELNYAKFEAGVGLLGGPPPSVNNTPFDTGLQSPSLANLNDSTLLLTNTPPRLNGSCVRTVAISPDCRHLAAGDRDGTLRVYSLETLEEITHVAAHDGEILSLSFFQSVSVPELSLLCSASRDRLIHIFDPNQQFSLVQTVSDHSAAIFAARIVETDDDGEIRLISCGMDKSLLIRVLEPDDAGLTARFSLEHHLVGRCSQLDAALTPTLGPSGENKSTQRRRYLAVACQDRRLRIYNVSTGRQVRCYRGSFNEEGCLLRCAIDPTGSIVATSGSDKQLNLFHLLSGESIATLFGHSELVLGIRFLPTLQRMVTVSSDGCIFIWRLSANLVNLLRERPLDRSTSLSTLPFPTISRSMSSLKISRSRRSRDVVESSADDLSSLLDSCESPVTEGRPTINEPRRYDFHNPRAFSSFDLNIPSDSNPEYVNVLEGHLKPDQASVAPAFYFSVSALPAWAQRKLSHRCSAGLVPVSSDQSHTALTAVNKQSNPPELTESSDSLVFTEEPTHSHAAGLAEQRDLMTTSEYHPTDRGSTRVRVKDSRRSGVHAAARSRTDPPGIVTSAPSTPFRRVPSSLEYDRCHYSIRQATRQSTTWSHIQQRDVDDLTNVKQKSQSRGSQKVECVHNVAAFSEKHRSPGCEDDVERVVTHSPNCPTRVFCETPASVSQDTGSPLYDPTPKPEPSTSFPKEVGSVSSSSNVIAGCSLRHSPRVPRSPQSTDSTRPTSTSRVNIRRQFFSSLESEEQDYPFPVHTTTQSSLPNSVQPMSPITSRSHWTHYDKRPSISQSSPRCAVRPNTLRLSSTNHKCAMNQSVFTTPTEEEQEEDEEAQQPCSSRQCSTSSTIHPDSNRLSTTLDALNALQQALSVAIQRCSDFKATHGAETGEINVLSSFVSEELQWRFAKLRALLGLEPMCVDPPVARALLAELVERLVPELRANFQTIDLASFETPPPCVDPEFMGANQPSGDIATKSNITSLLSREKETRIKISQTENTQTTNGESYE